MVLEWLIPLSIFLLILALFGIRIVQEYQKAVVFRLGSYSRMAGPGLIWIIPIFERAVIIDKRIAVIDIAKQEAITKDNVACFVNAVVFFKVLDAAKAVIQVLNYRFAISQLAQTTLRSVIGEVELDDLLSNREKINAHILEIVDHASDAWGIDVTRVEMKDLELPENMKRAMARQAESERERRSRIILADGELQAAQKLSKASDAMRDGGIYLRLLQTIQEISTENSSTVILPFPADLTGLAQTFSAKLISGDEPAK